MPRRWKPGETPFIAEKRGPKTPKAKYPRPPIFGKPARRDTPGAWRNFGGWWIQER